MKLIFMKLSFFTTILLCVFFINCSSPTVTDEIIDEVIDDIDLPVVNTKPNILLVIADDVSKDAVPNYTEGSIKSQYAKFTKLNK